VIEGGRRQAPVEEVARAALGFGVWSGVWPRMTRLLSFGRIETFEPNIGLFSR
jgi:hypothetical protein